MNIDRINMPSVGTFRQQTQTNSEKPKKEFIDVIANNVMNPRDVQDCVAVPRGIFKAYILLMLGGGLISIANFLPDKAKAVKTTLSVIGCISNILSAFFFAKPFAFKGQSPTVNQKDYNNN